MSAESCAPLATRFSTPSDEPVSQANENVRMRAVFSLGVRQLQARSSQADDEGCVLGAGAAPALVAATGDGSDGRVNVLLRMYKMPDAFGSIELVRREAEHVDAEPLATSKRQLAAGLDRVGVEAECRWTLAIADRAPANR